MSLAGGIIHVPRPFPASITDSFNRADSATTMGSTDTGQLWVPNHGTWGINGNRAYEVATAADNQETTVVQSGIADCTIAVTLAIATSQAGICFRCSDPNNLWVVLSTGTAGALQTYKRVAGTFTQLGTNGLPCANGDVLSVVLSGSSITVKKNGTTVAACSGTDAHNATATKHGLYIFSISSTAARFDDFSIAA